MKTPEGGSPDRGGRYRLGNRYAIFLLPVKMKATKRKYKV